MTTQFMNVYVHAHDIPTQYMCMSLKVSSKTKHVVHYNVKCGDIIIWEFATKKRDIGFGEILHGTCR